MKFLKIITFITFSLSLVPLYCTDNAFKQLFNAQKEAEQLKKDKKILIKGSLLNSLKTPHAYLNIKISEAGGMMFKEVIVATADPSAGVKLDIWKPTEIIVQRKSYGKTECQGTFKVEPGDILTLDCSGNLIVKK